MMLDILSPERKPDLRYAMNTIHEKPPETIHARIQRLRKAKGWTQQDLAIQVSSREGLEKPLLRQTVTQWEDGSSAPHRDRLAIVAEVLGVSVAELLSGEAVAPAPVAIAQQMPLIERRKGGASSAALPVKGEICGDHGEEPRLQPFAAPFTSVDFPTLDRGAYVLRVATNLLQPRYRQGEFVVLEPSFPAQPGDDVLVTCKSGKVLMRVLAWEREDMVQLADPSGGLGGAIPRRDILAMHIIVGHLRQGTAVKPA